MLKQERKIILKQIKNKNLKLHKNLLKNLSDETIEKINRLEPNKFNEQISTLDNQKTFYDISKHNLMRAVKVGVLALGAEAGFVATLITCAALGKFTGMGHAIVAAGGGIAPVAFAIAKLKDEKAYLKIKCDEYVNKYLDQPIEK